MSSSVESRIVSMKFDNRDFERGVSTTLHSLGTLSKALDAGFTAKAAGGLSRISSAIRGFSFGSMGSAVDGISGKFIALSTVAVTALSRITNAAITAGIDFAKQFSGLQAAQQGFAEYEQKLGSIQTILANTGRDLNNQKDLNEVTAALDELNTYSDKTIYNFGEMARNIGTFTAAGVDLETSVNSIKGVANIAALSGSNAQQASTAMYQLSQAIAAGKVGLQDWNSVVNAGMGGKVFQTALTRTAVAMGEIDASAVKLNEETGQLTVNGMSFRESISAIGEEKWLTGNVLTNTLAQFSGDLTDAQLRAQGFTDAQIQDIRKLADTAVDAATKVKTITQLVGTIQEALASGWAKTWEIIIGDFGEAKRLFTSINDVIGGFIQRQADARNEMLEEWKRLGGRDDLLAGFANLFTVFKRIVKPIRNAFRDIFPRTTGEQLAKITEGFRKFTEFLIYSRGTMRDIREIFRGVFTVFRVGFGILGGIIKYVAEFFGIIITGGGGDALGAVVGLVSEFANVVTWLGKWLEEGDKIGKFFDVIIDARNDVLEPLVGTIGAIVEAFVSLARGDVTGFFDHLEDSGNSLLDVFGVVGDKISSFVSGLGDFFAELGSGGASAFDTVAGKMSEFFDRIGTFFSELGSGGFDAIAAIFENIGDAIDNVKDKLNFGDGVNVEAGGLSGVGEQLDQLSWIAEAFGAVWSVLGDVFSFVGDTIQTVAPRLWRTLGIVGDKVLEFVETMSLEDLIAIINTGVFIMLYRAFTRLADGLGGFAGVGESVIGSFDQLTATLETMQTAVQAQLILAIATAVGVLAASLIALSFVPPDKLKNAGAAIAGMITGIVAAMKVLGAGGGKSEIAGEIVGEDLQLNLLSVAAAMIGMAVAITILAGAMKILEKTDWESFGKLSALIGVLVTAMLILGKGAPVAAAAGGAIFLMSAGLVVLAGALKLYEKIDWESIGKMAVILTALALALAAVGNPVIGPLVLAGAAAMFIMAPAIIGIAIALRLLSKVKWQTIGKLAVVLTTLALGVTAMIAALPGAIALGVLAVGLTVLMPVLKTLGEMDFGTFVKSLGLVLVTLLGLGAVTSILGVLSPLMLAFGAALTVVGVGMVLVGGGTLALATGLGILAAAGTAGVAVLIGAITAFLAVLPQWVLQFGQTLNAIIYVLREAGPPFVEMLGEIMRKLLEEIADSADEWGNALEKLIEEGLRVIRNTSDDWVDTAMKLIDDFLDGVDENMDDIADKGADIIIKFLKGVQRNDDKIAAQGVRTIGSLALAMGRAIFGVLGWLWQQAWQIGSSLVGGIVAGLQALWHHVTDWVEDQINKIPGKIRDLMGISSPSKVMRELGGYMSLGLALGLRDKSKAVDDETAAVANNAKRAMLEAMGSLNDVDVEALEFDPTIRPVLDLSEVEAGASQLASLLDPGSLNAQASLAEARSLASSIGAQNGQNGGDSAGNDGGDTFIQNNYSPKAISPVETYRGTKSLLAMKRRGTGKTNETYED